MKLNTAVHVYTSCVVCKLGTSS